MDRLWMTQVSFENGDHFRGVVSAPTGEEAVAKTRDYFPAGTHVELYLEREYSSKM